METPVNAHEPARFTRDSPVDKTHLWNTFTVRGAFRQRKVIEARAEIGLNAPKYLIKKGYVEELTHAGVEYYRVTQAGQEWLEAGLKKLLAKHPDRAKDVPFPPGYSSPGMARARQEAAAGTRPKPSPLRRTRPPMA